MRDRQIGAQVAALSTRYPSVQPQMLTEVVRDVIASLRNNPPGNEGGLMAEVQALGRTIAAARAEIAALRVDDITVSHIPSATDQLDAIVVHTAAATDTILEVCETLDGLADTLGRDATSPLTGAATAKLQEATTQIYEACSFQDLTGQRISKVVTALKSIEAKVAQIMSTFGEASDESPAREALPEEVSLLNGPQLPAHAMGQSEIDKLMASFD